MQDFSAYESYQSFAFWTIASGITVIVCLGVTLLFTAVLTVVFRSLNHRSEALCDRIACILTGEEGIKTSLQLFRQHGGGWKYLDPSFYPSGMLTRYRD